MGVRLLKYWVWLGLACFSLHVHSGEILSSVALHNPGTGTYYIEGQFGHLQPIKLLVDTGSSFSTIDKKTLTALKASGDATFIRNQSGILADGTKIEVPLYRIKKLALGDICMVEDVEVAVFPNGRRHILGLNVLAKLTPFSFSLEPPRLTLAGCTPPSMNIVKKEPSLASTP
ncbi:MAG: hypothetical protein AXA67_06860 [Methylothermaceae bacteria B42]|nr:MAG: hypothetical protein AXA67_06860 [Methylothermaceae bacteria B42]HHJ40255.1 hypothetical protein [Methylothermaceae bacterium]